MTVSPLRFELHRYGVLRDKLLEAFPEADDETIRDTLEGITTLDALIAEIVRSALLDEGLQRGLRSRLDDMKQRLARLEHRGDTKRQLALEAMSEVGLRKLEAPDFTVSLRAGPPALVVVAEQEIPDAYWVPQPAKLDRQALLHELKTGAAINGVQLGNPKSTLSVRTK